MKPLTQVLHVVLLGMQTPVYTFLIGISLLFTACSEGDEDKSKVEPKTTTDYRDMYVGFYNCVVINSVYQSGVTTTRDTFGVLDVSLPTSGADSTVYLKILHLDKYFGVKANGILTSTPGHTGDTDSVGYFAYDSVYLEWLITRSPGREELYYIKGKRIK